MDCYNWIWDRSRKKKHWTLTIRPAVSLATVLSKNEGKPSLKALTNNCLYQTNA